MRTTSDERRQIFSLLLQGDVVGPLPGKALIGVCQQIAMTPVTLVDVSGLLVFPGIRAAIGELQAQTHRRLFDHVVRLGVQTSYERLAHLLLEIYTRQAEVGVATGSRLRFPIGQERLGEMLGLSGVHISRTFARLRKDGHVEAGQGWIALLRLRELAKAVGFPESAAW